MRLRRLSLFNFKAFSGEHSIVLPDGGDDRPVYLFGGLNGAGKTTLTQAFVLALHGERAGGLPGMFAAGRDTRKNYRAWLRAAFSQPARSAGEDQMQTSVQLSDAGVDLTITRSWWFDAAGNYVEEALDVREEIPGGTSLLAGDEAQALIDHFLPRHLLDFAVFDGEQVRRLDDTLSAVAVRTALDRLLDLDAVERNRNEIERLSRERRLAQADEGQLRAYETMRRQLDELTAARAATVDRLRQAEDDQHRMQRELDQLTTAFDFSLTAGAAPGQLSADLVALRERRATLRSALGRHLGEWLYLLPGQSTASALAHDVADEREQRTGRDRIKLGLEALEELTDAFKQNRQIKRKVGAAAAKVVDGWLTEAVAARRANLDAAIVAGDGSALGQFNDAELADLESALSSLSRDTTDVVEISGDLLRVDRRIRELEGLLAAADGDNATSQLLLRRDELNVLLGSQTAISEQLRAEVEALDLELASQRARLGKLEQRLVVDADDQQWLASADATIAALDEFLADARADASAAVRTRMLRNLKLLLRKASLVHDVVIDPVTHVTRLVGKRGDDVELPSAGEHQLAAMAFIDAVLATSTNPLPVFVDTPLARLDSRHRRAVVRDFWPNLGRQVIVLSTDEEVVGDLLQHAAPSVAATYRIDCSDDGESTVKIDQYFEGLAS